MLYGLMPINDSAFKALTAVNATDGSVVWQVTLPFTGYRDLGFSDSSDLTPLLITADAIYFHDLMTFMAFERQNGSTRFSFTPPGNDTTNRFAAAFGPTLTTDGSVVFLSSIPYALWNLHPVSGAVQWSLDLRPFVGANYDGWVTPTRPKPVCAADGTLYIGDLAQAFTGVSSADASANYVLAVNSSTGEVRWILQASGLKSPVAIGKSGQLYFASSTALVRVGQGERANCASACYMFLLSLIHI